MACAIPPAIAPRIGALLRMLGSPVDGEALNAARALGRTLRGAGVDWHTLADAVEHPAVIVERPEPTPQARRSRKARPGDVELDFERRMVVSSALRRALASDRLSEWQAEFATSILARLQAGHGRLTEKQSETLKRLLRKLGEGAVWASV